jgi:hypothetical protein
MLPSPPSYGPKKGLLWVLRNFFDAEEARSQESSRWQEVDDIADRTYQGVLDLSPPLPCLVGKDELFSKTDARLQNNVIDTTDTGKGYESGEKDGHQDTT